MTTRRPKIPFREQGKCTVRQAAAFSGVGYNKIHEWIRDGLVKSVKIDGGGKGTRLIDVPSLLSLLDGEVAA